jgi:crotonobetainyl-CoA:carnitine CoA-transferase CaiB-like acyl-CoA transferase
MSKTERTNLTVIDLTHGIAGPYCTKLMAGFNANVIKIERPHGGDLMRSRGPFFQNKPDQEGSIPFLWLNTGKKSITLNLKSETGCEIFKRLVRTADIVIESFSPKVMAGFGLSYSALKEINSRLIMTSISNFGQYGPYRDYQAEEIVEYALSGLMNSTGDPEKAPLCSGPATSQYTAGMVAYVATLMAMYRKGVNGRGQYLDISIQECALDNIEVTLMEYLHLGKVAKRSNDRHALVPWQLYPCRDGYAAVMGGPVRHWLGGADLFEEPRLLEKQFQHMWGRINNREEFESLLQPWLNRNGKKEIYHAGQARRLAFGYLATLPEVLESPQHNARGYFEEIDHPVTGKQKYCGPPFKLSETPWRTVRAPLLGEHNEEIYGEFLGYSSAEIQSLKEDGVI